MNLMTLIASMAFEFGSLWLDDDQIGPASQSATIRLAVPSDIDDDERCLWCGVVDCVEQRPGHGANDCQLPGRRARPCDGLIGIGIDDCDCGPAFGEFVPSNTAEVDLPAPPLELAKDMVGMAMRLDPFHRVHRHNVVSLSTDDSLPTDV